MTGNNSSNRNCSECGAILRQLREAWRGDYRAARERVRDAWLASGLKLDQFYKAYLSGPDAEIDERFQADFPRFAEMRRRASEHELLTGHSVVVHGWRDWGIGGDLTSWFR